MVQTSGYIISLVDPEMNESWSAWALEVVWQGGDRWAVTRNHQAMDRDGNWSWQTADNRSDPNWLALYRFAEREAVELAIEYAPKVVVNGRSAQHVYDRFMAELEEAKAG